jgi:hypothetical protein
VASNAAGAGPLPAPERLYLSEEEWGKSVARRGIQLPGFHVQTSAGLHHRAASSWSSDTIRPISKGDDDAPFLNNTPSMTIPLSEGSSRLMFASLFKPGTAGYQSLSSNCAKGAE